MTPTALLHGLGDLVFLLDRDQRITAAYGEWIRSGRSRASRWLGKRMVEEWPKDIAAQHAAMNARALEGQVVVYDWEYPVAGSGRRMLTTVCPVHGADGRVKGIVRATRLLARGTRPVSSRATPPPDVLFRLSPREGLVASMLLDSARTSQIARDLKISIHTVRQHIKHILKKTRVHSQEELIDLLRGTPRADATPRRRSVRARR